MLTWAAIVGAVVGWFAADFESYGLLIGGATGLLVGWGLRRAVRAEINAAINALTAESETRLASEVSAPATANSQTQRRSALSIAMPVIDPPENLADERKPPAPEEPGIIAQAVTGVLAAAKSWIFGGNTIIRVGIIILFVGLSFLASFAASAGLFPVELRLALVAAAGAGLLIVGFRTRGKRAAFGLALQGAGVASIYLTLFAAARLVEGFSLTAAFMLMALVCALGCSLALLQRSQALAVTGFAGGFAVPMLLSSGGGNVVALFSFYTLLNVAILFIAGQRSWRLLSLVGFFSTFGVLTLYMAGGYQAAQFFATQSFLIASVVIYVAAAILYTQNTPGLLGNAIDTTLLFGPALAGFGLEVGLVDDQPFGSAFAAIAFGALYLAVAAFTARRRPENFRVMSEAMLAIGVGFVTLAIPLALGARWTSAAWALEGVGAFWIGMRQSRWLPRLFGIALQLVAAAIYLEKAGPAMSAMPIANAAFMGAMLIALAVLATGWWLRHDLAQDGSRLAKVYGRAEAKLGRPAFLLGFAFWWAAWASETGRMLPPMLAGQAPIAVFSPPVGLLLAMLAYITSAWGAQLVGQRTGWRVATWPSHASLAALLIGFVGMIGWDRHLLYAPDIFIWLAAIALHLRMLYGNDRDVDATSRQRLLTGIHVAGVWLATAMIADCLWLAVERGRLWNTSWAGVVFLASGVAVMIALTLWATRAIAPNYTLHWPLDRHAAAYGWLAAAPIAALVFASTFATALFASGNAEPLPYIPIINPVDLVLALALAGLTLWRHDVIAARPVPAGATILHGRGSIAALAALTFVVINTVWLRIAHQLLGIDWDPDALLDSVVVQTGLAILWTLLALPLMVLAHRRAERTMWLVGAGLLGLTVAKLLLVDLNNAGGGARIVAFIAVGVLMLVVGYLAPLPPREKAREAGREEAQPV